MFIALDDLSNDLLVVIEYVLFILELNVDSSIDAVLEGTGEDVEAGTLDTVTFEPTAIVSLL